MAVERTTRRPTGAIAWPFVHVSGTEQTGKTYSLLAASGDPRIGRFLYIPFGEFDADEYGAIPGADFDIVDTDGTYQDVLEAVQWATSQPPVDGKPVAVALDSATRLWELLSAEADSLARERAVRKAVKYHKPVPGPEDEVQITSDLWNRATGRFKAIIDLLSLHQGPSFMTSRLKEVSIMDSNGQPTKEKEWRPEIQKHAPYAATVTVQFREYRTALITRAKSISNPVPEGVIEPFPDFTISALFDALGIGDGSQITGRSGGTIDVAGSVRDSLAMVDPVKVCTDLRDAGASASPVAALTAFGGQYPEDILRAVQYERQDGSTVSAWDQLGALMHWARGAEEKRAREAAESEAAVDRVRDAVQEPARTDVQESVQQDEVVRAQPEQDARAQDEPVSADAPPEEKLARVQALGAAAAERARTESATGNAALMAAQVDELAGQADVLDLTLEEHVQPLLERSGKTVLDDCPPLKVRGFVRDQRAFVLEALRSQGRATEAEAYEKNMTARAQGLTWAQMTYAPEVEDAAVEESVDA